MKKEDLFEVLGDIDEEKVIKAADKQAGHRRPAWIRWTAIAACILLCVGLIRGGSLFKPVTDDSGDEDAFSAALAYGAEYPDAVAEGMDPGEYQESDEHWNWWEDTRENIGKSSELQKNLSGYYTDIMKDLLTSDDENTVCSPLNTYIAFAMLAEVSEGNTRQQVLDMLGASDIKVLRDSVYSLWQSNYADTPSLKSVLANSFWLNDKVGYKEKALKVLAEKYFASSFSGTPGSKDMDEALHQWIDNNTGGLLTEYSKDIKLDPDTVLALVSTIYYKAAWVDEFLPENTVKETFHGARGDTDTDMMHRTGSMAVSTTDSFTAVQLGLTDSGYMTFYLPNEGRDVNDLASDPEVLDAFNYDIEGRVYNPIVNLSVPKFSVSSKKDLLDTLKTLGVTDALDPDASDFSPLTDEISEIYVANAEHAAKVEIDEEGVTGAAYTELMLDGNGMPMDEIDFVIDRPFMFTIHGWDGSVLFAGIIRNID